MWPSSHRQSVWPSSHHSCSVEPLGARDRSTQYPGAVSGPRSSCRRSPRARSTSRLPCAEVQTLLGGNELPHIPAEPRIPPPAIAIAVASAVVAIVPYLLDSATLNVTGLQLLKHARCRRGVRCGHREAERNAQRSDRQQLTCHDVIPSSRFQSAAHAAVPSAILGGIGSGRCSRSVPAAPQKPSFGCWAERVSLWSVDVTSAHDQHRMMLPHHAVPGERPTATRFNEACSRKLWMSSPSSLSR